jgi:hypothetical protein
MLMILVVLGVLIAPVAQAQERPVTIRWFGWSFFLVTAADGLRIAMDPFSNIGYTMPTVEADVVTVSHEHGDHNNVGLIRGTPRVFRGLSAGAADWNRVYERFGNTLVFAARQDDPAVELMYFGVREQTIRSQFGHIQLYRRGFAARGAVAPFELLIPDYDAIRTMLAPLEHVVDVLPRLGFSGLISTGEATTSFVGLGVDAERESTLSSFARTIEGEELSSAAPRGVILGLGLARGFGVRPGDDRAVHDDIGLRRHCGNDRDHPIQQCRSTDHERLGMGAGYPPAEEHRRQDPHREPR